MNPDGRVNELNQAFHTMFSSPQTAAQRMFMFMQGMFPPLRIIVCSSSFYFRGLHADWLNRVAHGTDARR